MPKKSKRRHRRSSSSSTEEEKKARASKRKEVTKSCKRDKRKHESHAAKQEKSCSPRTKHDSQNTRHVKKPVYRLEKKGTTDQKHSNKPVESTETRHVSLLSHRDNNYISGSDKNVSGSKTVEKRPSKRLSTDIQGSVPQKTAKISKGIDEKSSRRSPLKLKKPTSSSLVSSEKKEHRHHVQKKTQPRPGNDGSAFKMRETSKAKEPSKIGQSCKTGEQGKTGELGKVSFVIKDSLVQKRIEVVKNICKKHQDNEFNAKRILVTEAKSSSMSPRNNSSISAKHIISERSSKLLKNVAFVPRSVTSFSHKTASSSSIQQQKDSSTKPLPPNFKIPKKVPPRAADSTGDSHDAVSANKNFRNRTEILESAATINNSKQETIQHHHSFLDASQNVQDKSSYLSDPYPTVFDANNSQQEAIHQHYTYLDVSQGFSSEGQNKSLSLSDQFPTVCNATSEPRCDQIQVVEELQLARTERKLEVDVLQSYGELTCMEIDPPEEGGTDVYCKQPLQQDLIIVLDTNILLSHLDYVKKIGSHGLGALGFPVILIPWVVLQELDSLKRGKDLSGSVAHLAIPAISYIYNTLKSREPHMWGQSMQQASEGSNGLSAENNDDRVLHCCLQYQSLYPGCVILCTNDKNLCSKALLSGVKAFSKNDLEAEVGGARLGLHSLQNIEPPMLPHLNPQISSPVLRRSCTTAQPHIQERADLSVGVVMKREQQHSAGEEGVKWDLSRCISELKETLRDVLSDVVEVEMKAAYEDLWLEIVCLKPPWTLQDVLQCLKKHWIAVFGHIVPRKKQQVVLNLIEFFNSGKTVDRDATLAALREAKELVTAFGKSSSRVASAISIMDRLFSNLQPQGESQHACDVVMNDDEEDRQPMCSQVSHQEVWALFENVWCRVYQLSLEVFKALGFDCNTMQSAQPAGCPQPPQDALACLHKLSSMVSQLLQAFSSVLSSAPSLEEVQTLLNIITSNKIVDVDFRVTPKDLLDCFSQQDYREKLRVGGTQLQWLKEALDRCVEFTGQIMIFAAQPEWNSAGTYAHQPNRSLE